MNILAREIDPQTILNHRLSCSFLDHNREVLTEQMKAIQLDAAHLLGTVTYFTETLKENNIALPVIRGEWTADDGEVRKCSLDMSDLMETLREAAAGEWSDLEVEE